MEIGDQGTGIGGEQMFAYRVAYKRSMFAYRVAIWRKCSLKGLRFFEGLTLKGCESGELAAESFPFQSKGLHGTTRPMIYKAIYWGRK